MSAGPITSPLPPSIYSSPVASPLSRDGVTIAVIDAALDTSKIPKSGVLPGVIRDVSRDGTVRIDTDAGPITARLPDRVTTTPGQQVRVELPREDQRPTTPTISVQRAQLSSVPPADTSTAPNVTPKDLYTQSPRPVSSSPAPDLNAIAQTSNGIKLSPGEMVQARAISLPDAIKLLAQSTSLPIATTTLPLGTSHATTILLPHETTSPLIMMTGWSVKNLFPMLSLSLFADDAGPITNRVGLFPPGVDGGSSTSSKSFLFPAVSNFSLTSGALPAINASPAGPMPAGILSMTIDDIGSGLVPTFTTSGAGAGLPSPVSPGVLSSSIIAQRFIVMGQTPTNETILATGVGDEARSISTFIIPSNAKSGPWPTGTIFSARVLAPLQLPTLSIQQMTSPSTDTDLWSLFDDLNTMNLQNTGASVARLPIPNLSAPQNFGTALFMFLAALRSGSIPEFLGDTAITAIKQKGRGDRIDRLSDIGRSLTASIDTANGPWRSVQIPVQTDQGVMPMILHVKHHHDDPDDQSRPNKKDIQNPGQRVVMDVVFDRMGSVQMDMHLPRQSKRLDTILRTEIPLSRAMQGAITRLYAGAIAKTHLTGEIIFQGDHHHWFSTTKTTENNIELSA